MAHPKQTNSTPSMPFQQECKICHRKFEFDKGLENHSRIMHPKQTKETNSTQFPLLPSDLVSLSLNDPSVFPNSFTTPQPLSLTSSSPPPSDHDVNLTENYQLKYQKKVTSKKETCNTDQSCIFKNNDVSMTSKFQKETFPTSSDSLSEKNLEDIPDLKQKASFSKEDENKASTKHKKKKKKKTQLEKYYEFLEHMGISKQDDEKNSISSNATNVENASNNEKEHKIVITKESKEVDGIKEKCDWEEGSREYTSKDAERNKNEDKLFQKSIMVMKTTKLTKSTSSPPSPVENDAIESEYDLSNGNKIDETVSNINDNSSNEDTDKESNYTRFNMDMDSLFNYVYNPEYTDLCTEFADSEVFLVDADSLFFEIVNKEHFCYRHYAGCSSLHIIYLMEKALSEFVRRGGKFHLLFFKSAKHLYKYPSTTLLREAALLHFKMNTNLSVKLDFEDALDENFKRFLETEKPTFVLTHVGNFSRRSLCSDYFQVNFQTFQAYSLNCADISGISSSTALLDGWYIKANPVHRQNYISQTKKSHRFILSVMMLKTQSDQDKKILDVEKMVDDVHQVEDILDVEKTSDASQSNHYYSGLIDIVKSMVNNSNSAIGEIFIISEVLKKNLPLSYRLSKENKFSILKDSTLSKGMGNLHTNMINSLPQYSKECISDLVDIQFILKIIHEIHAYAGMKTIPELFAEEIKENWQILSDFEAITNELMGTNIDLLGEFVDHIILSEFNLCITKVNTISAKENIADKFFIFSINNPLYNEYVGNYPEAKEITKISTGEAEMIMTESRKFEEKYHWHFLKKLSDEYDRIRDNRENTHQKQNQKHANYMTKYGTSIEGKIMTEKPIVVNKTQGKGGKGTKPEKQKLSVKKIQLQSLKQKFEKECKEILDQKYKDVKKENLQKTVSHFEDRYKHYKNNYMNVLNGVKMVDLTNDKMHTYFREKILGLYLKIIKMQFEEFKTQENLEATIILTVRKLTNYISDMNEKQKDTLRRYLAKLGYLELVKNLGLGATTKEYGTERKSIARFQLEHMGKHLEMESPEEIDPRVDSFNPDLWQRELFDAIDKRESALIVAPTSSGKTYASYYCMETILRESDDGVVVYVSPTKALVNQVAATVCARFSHRKNVSPGKSVYGVFTRDFRENTLNSQILVTVPECLEILLFSPQRIEWAKKIQYVIFDEVHNIGAESRGEVWEHIMMLIRCPFLALSATIENPRHLLMWLQNGEDFKRIRNLQDKNMNREGNSYKVNLVTCTERHSDLDKYVFAPEDGDVNLLPIHPIATLSHLNLNIEEEGKIKIPDHIRLSPKECVQLYDVLETVHGKENVKEIEPSVFCGENFFKRNIVTNYANKIKMFLCTRLQKSGTNKDHYLNVVTDKLLDKSRIGQEDIKLTDERDYLKAHFVDLMMHLQQDNKLPAIIFVFNRHYCENLAIGAVNHFQKEIERIQETKEYKLEQKLVEQETRLLEKKTKKLRDQEKENEDSRNINTEFSADGETALQYLTEHFNNFPTQSFISKNNLGNETAEFVLRRLKDSCDSDFIECLRFGISWHHAGNNARMRSSTEMLFREQFIKVAIATTTLAQGIHMPCKSVIFAGDCVYLNSLNYHQCSGRAGRRGFDTEGNVIFYGIPSKKVARLMNAKLPKLVGNNPTSVSLILRLLVMTSTCSEDNNRDALSRALCLLENPLIALNNPDMRSQLKHFFIYSCEFLAKQGLIDPSGSAVGFAGLVCHLHYYEPYNLAFCHLLRSGVFHSLCVYNKFGNFSRESLENLLITVSFLFARMKLRPTFYAIQKAKFPTANSIIRLPPLLEIVKHSLEKFNQEINANFQNYLLSASKCLKSGKQDNILPLSNIEYHVGDYDQEENYRLISPFAMLSGLTDESINSENNDIQVINSNIRQRILTDTVPKLNMRECLNSYALDFYNNGIQEELRIVNGIQSGEVFNLLKDFSLLLKAISTSLQEMGPSEDPLEDIVVKAFSQLSKEFDGKFYKTFTGADHVTYTNGCIKEHPHSCAACNIILPGNKVNNLARTRPFGIRGRFGCSTGWVVYTLSCQSCKVQYVGASIQPMATKVKDFSKNFHIDHQASLMIVDGTNSGNDKELNNKKIQWTSRLQAIAH